MVEAATAWAIDLPGLTIAETSASISVLRVRKADEAAAALGGAFAAPWPSQPNTVSEAGVRIAWLAPGEWAIFDTADRLEPRIRTACEGLTHHLADVSAGRRLWRIQGAQARALIAKGCSLDTDASVLPVGRCAQSLLAQVQILLVPVGADRGQAETFDMVADASFAGHLRAWFADAALEYRP